MQNVEILIWIILLFNIDHTNIDHNTIILIFLCWIVYQYYYWDQDFWEKYQQLQICKWCHSNDRKWRGIEKPLDEGERGKWKTWFKTQHKENQDHDFWSHLIPRQIEGEKVEAMTNFIFLGSKITVDGGCNNEIKRHLLLGRKTITNLDSVLKSRDITLPTKVCIVKALVFPVVTYGCERP